MLFRSYDMMKLSKFFNIQYSRIFYIYSRLLDEARNFGVKTYAKPMHTDEPDVITKMSDPKFRGLMSILQDKIDKATSEDDKKKYTIMKDIIPNVFDLENPKNTTAIAEKYGITPYKAKSYINELKNFAKKFAKELFGHVPPLVEEEPHILDLAVSGKIVRAHV